MSFSNTENDEKADKKTKREVQEAGTILEKDKKLAALPPGRAKPLLKVQNKKDFWNKTAGGWKAEKERQVARAERDEEAQKVKQKRLLSIAIKVI